MSAKPSFFAELQRRNVYKVGAMYAVSGWLLVQIVTQVLPIFDVSALAQRIIVLVIVAGFPLALVLSWVYELTPQGIVKTDEVAPDASTTRNTGKKLNRAIIGVLSLAVLLLAARLLWPQAATAPVPPPQASAAPAAGDKSIAVLPFENLSDDKANAYFTTGIQDEILTRLARVGALKVISRTSTQHYASSPDNLPQIARELGVANILEGTVQKAGDSVHINVQLIRAATDEHLWADSYNRKLDDVFAVEGEVAQTIAETLKARLTAAEQQALKDKPTDNAAAYAAYSQGRAIETGAYDYGESKRALAAYQEAVRQDPHFALAWAHAAIAGSFLLFNGVAVSGYSSRDVLTEADTALSLQPDLGEAWLAQGYYRYRMQRDYPGALQAFEEARKRLPNDPQVLLAIWIVERRVGRWDDALQHMHQSLELDPRNVNYLVGAVIDLLINLRRFDEARQMLDRALQIAPLNPDALDTYAVVEQMEGHLDAAARRLAQLPPDTDFAGQYIFTPVDQAIYERRFPDAIALIDRYIAPAGKPLLLDQTFGLAVQRGQLLAWLGRKEEAREAFTRVVQAIKPTPDSPVPVNEIFLSGMLAFAYAGLGEREAALDALRTEQAAYKNDSFDSAAAELHRAEVLAQLGDTDTAAAALPQLLQLPSGLTAALLKLDPVWDPLRGDARFKKLVSGG